MIHHDIEDAINRRHASDLDEEANVEGKRPILTLVKTFSRGRGNIDRTSKNRKEQQKTLITLSPSTSLPTYLPTYLPGSCGMKTEFIETQNFLRRRRNKLSTAINPSATGNNPNLHTALFEEAVQPGRAKDWIVEAWKGGVRSHSSLERLKFR